MTVRAFIGLAAGAALIATAAQAQPYGGYRPHGDVSCQAIGCTDWGGGGRWDGHDRRWDHGRWDGRPCRGDCYYRPYDRPAVSYGYSYSYGYSAPAYAYGHAPAYVGWHGYGVPAYPYAYPYRYPSTLHVYGGW